MFWKKAVDPTPRGVRLGDLLLILEPTSIRATIQGSALVARHEHFTVRVEVIPPEGPQPKDSPIRAVVRVVSDLPGPVAGMFKGKEEAMAGAFNPMAALGAFTTERSSVYVGSRLTIYEAEDAWANLHLPLILFTVIGATEGLLGAMRRAFSEEDGRGGASDWTEGDFERVERNLSPHCVCTTGGLGFTAEFGLGAGAKSAAIGDHETALFQLTGEQPHPELGGGLFSLLQMPHQLRDESRLHAVCAKLNTMEMEARDLPPHFGAWCPGRLGNNPAYVSFFPNSLHSAQGVAVNAAFWALNRAEWANEALSSFGIRP